MPIVEVGAITMPFVQEVSSTLHKEKGVRPELARSGNWRQPPIADGGGNSWFYL